MFLLKNPLCDLRAWRSAFSNSFDDFIIASWPHNYLNFLETTWFQSSQAILHVLNIFPWFTLKLFWVSYSTLGFVFVREQLWRLLAIRLLAMVSSMSLGIVKTPIAHQILLLFTKIMFLFVVLFRKNYFANANWKLFVFVLISAGQ